MPDVRLLKQAKIGLLVLNIPILLACAFVVATQPSMRSVFIPVGILQLIGVIVIFRYVNQAIIQAQEKDKEDG